MTKTEREVRRVLPRSHSWRRAEWVRVQSTDSQAHVFSLYMLILIPQSLHFKNPSLYSHTHWKGVLLHKAWRLQVECIHTRMKLCPWFPETVSSGWCVWWGGGVGAALVCSGKAFILSSLKCIPVIDVFVKPEAQYSQELGLGNFALGLTQSKPKLPFAQHGCIHPLLTLPKGTHGEVSMAGLARGCGMCLCGITVWTSKHNIWKNEKKSVTLPHTPF